MTSEGETLLKEELQRLKFEERPSVIDAIATAREFGDLKENADILDFMKNRIDSLSDEYPVATHSHHRDGLYLTANCEIWGQTGPHWSSFNIHSSKEEFYKYLVDQGYIFWSNETFLSHSEADLILMFKKNITNKYFGG